MRKMKKINGYLVVKFNARELREYEGTALGEYGVIDAELYTGILDVDRGAMEYDNAGSMEEAVELARGLESELDAEEPEVKVTIVKETDETTEEEEVDAQQMIAGWENVLRGQVASAHYKDVDERTAAHELYGYKVALRDLGLLDREDCYVLPDTFGEAPGPLPKKPEELLAYVCDELCRHRRPEMPQEELDAVCEKCSLERLANEADGRDLRAREKALGALYGLVDRIRDRESSVEADRVGAEARAYGKKRKKAQKAQGLVTLSRTNDQGEAVKIEKGHIFKTQKDINGEELRFFAIEAAVLQKGSRSVDVLVEAEKEGSRYNVPEGQITRSLTFLNGIDGISNGEDWIVREGSDTEDDEGLRTRALRSWSELAARSIEDTFINAAEAVQGVLFAQADCDHPRGQGTVDVIVTGTAGEATEGLLDEVREAVDKIAGPYDNVLVKSSTTVSQDIEVTVSTSDVSEDEDIKNRISAILAELLAVRKGRRFNELRRSDINFAIRSNYSAATNAEIITPTEDVVLEKDKVITLGSVSVTVRRE